MDRAPLADIGERAGVLLPEVYRRLYDCYGPQHWWPGSRDPFEVIVGAILVQNTAWRNVARAVERLRAVNALSVDAIRAIDEAELADLIRSSGYYRGKARKLKAFVAMLDAYAEGDLAALLALPAEVLRTRLLATYGIGPETADDIVLYAAGKPSFVIDAYTRRIVDRLALAPPSPTYEGYRAMFMDALPPDAALYNEYHALLVRHSKVRCTRHAPLCDGCPLADLCTFTMASQTTGGVDVEGPVLS